MGTKHFTAALVPVHVKNIVRFDAKSEVDFVNTPTNNDREKAIDENLKKVFDQTLDEGIPDRFKDLLAQLRQQDTEQGQTK